MNYMPTKAGTEAVTHRDSHIHINAIHRMPAMHIHPHKYAFVLDVPIRPVSDLSELNLSKNIFSLTKQ